MTGAWRRGGTGVLLAVAAAWSCTLAVVSCTARREATARDASSVTVLYPGDERILGPYWEMPAKFLMFLPLVRHDQHGELEGVLARRWEHSPDYRIWTIHLRGDVRWHDGVAFTAHDVKFTWDLFSRPEILWNPPGAATVTVLDDTTLTITYQRRADSPLNPERVYYPRHLLQRLDPAKFSSWAFWTQPVGNGPYRYLRHVEKTLLELEANPNYFRGKPAIERVILKFTAGEHGLPELLSGNVDVLGWPGRMEVLNLAGDPRYVVYYQVYPATRAILWKASHPILQDARVRRAMTLAINRRELYALLGFPAEVPIVDGPYSDRQFLRRELLAPLPHDPGEARRLLEEAGWRDADGDGVREREGRPLRFTLRVPAEEQQAGVYVQEQLARVGVRLDLTTVDLNVIRQRQRSGDFEALLGGVNSNWQARFFGRDGVTGYRNARVAELLEQLDEVFDPDRSDAIYRELLDIFRVDQPATFLIPNVEQFVAPRWLRGLSSPYRADPLVSMEFLWIEGRP